MRGIVSDTTPLNYLILIEAIEILPRLYGRVLIPPAVKDELSRAGAPETVRRWIADYPSWLEIVPVSESVDTTLSHLHCGERDAISLASESQINRLLMDERDGAETAVARNITVIGTLGALVAAARHDWIALGTAFERLRLTTFRSPRRLMTSLLEDDWRRRQSQGRKSSSEDK